MKTEFSEKQLGLIVSRQHASYDDQLRHWEFLKESYYGGPGYFSNGNIFKHAKETSISYSNRIKRAYRFNHTKEVVDLINKYVFRGDIVRSEDAPQFLKDYWKQASWERRTIEQFIYQTSIQSSNFGRPWIIVDTNRCDAISANLGKVSVKQEKDAEHRLYTYVVEPQDVKDYAYDDDGCLEWIIIRETHRDDSDPFEDVGQVYFQYKLWTKNEWYLIRDARVEETTVATNAGGHNTALPTTEQNEAYELIDSGEHNLGEVPAIPANHLEAPEGEEPLGLISDIAYLDRAIANYLSNLDEIIQHQAFSQLAIPIQGLKHLPQPEEGCNNKQAQLQQMIAMGTDSIFTFDGEDGAVPFYLNPDPKHASLIMEIVGRIIQEIYSVAGLSAERTNKDNAVGIDNTSGVSKAFDFDRVNSLLVNKGRSLQRIENRIAHFVALYKGESLEKEYVSYSESYDTRTLSDDLALIKELTEIAAPEEFRKFVMEQLQEKTFPQLTEESVSYTHLTLPTICSV